MSSHLSKDQIRQSLRKNTAFAWAAGALIYVEKVVPFLHRLTFSGSYSYRQVENLVGGLNIRDSFDQARRMPNYNTMANSWLDNLLLTFFFNPTKPYLPPCYISLVLDENDPRQKLIALHEKLPDLKPSRIEYATDIFMEEAGPNSATQLFCVILKYLYIPNQRGFKIDGEKKARIGKKDRINFIARYGKNTKVYERGLDSLKDSESQGWQYENIDRVRLEHTADRRNLDRVDINTLKDLISHPHFTEINYPISLLSKTGS